MYTAVNNRETSTCVTLLTWETSATVDANIARDNSSQSSAIALRPNSSSSSFSLSTLSPYWCNRSLGVLTSRKNDSIRCFSPPQYYGQKCEYHADRLSVVLQLDLNQFTYDKGYHPEVLLKLVVLFVFKAEVLQRNQFHLHSSWQISDTREEEEEEVHLTLRLSSFILGPWATTTAILQSLFSSRCSSSFLHSRRALPNMSRRSTIIDCCLELFGSLRSSSCVSSSPYSSCPIMIRRCTTRRFLFSSQLSIFIGILSLSFESIWSTMFNRTRSLFSHSLPKQWIVFSRCSTWQSDFSLPSRILRWSMPMEEIFDSSFSFHSPFVRGSGDSVLWDWQSITRSHSSWSASLQKNSSSHRILPSRSISNDRPCFNQTVFISQRTFLGWSPSFVPPRECLFSSWNGRDLLNQSMFTHSILDQQSFLLIIRLRSIFIVLI